MRPIGWSKEKRERRGASREWLYKRTIACAIGGMREVDAELAVIERVMCSSILHSWEAWTETKTTKVEIKSNPLTTTAERARGKGGSSKLEIPATSCPR